MSAKGQKRALKDYSITSSARPISVFGTLSPSEVTEHNQRKFNSLFAMILNLYCLRLVLYSLDPMRTGGLRMESPRQFLTASIILIGMVIVIGYFL